MTSSYGSRKDATQDIELGPLNESFKFFLRGLPLDATAKEIRAHFSKFGVVNFVKLIRKSSTIAITANSTSISNNSDGYAFLYMFDAEGDAAVGRYALAQTNKISLCGKDRVSLHRNDKTRVKPLRSNLIITSGMNLQQQLHTSASTNMPAVPAIPPPPPPPPPSWAVPPTPPVANRHTNYPQPYTRAPGSNHSNYPATTSTAVTVTPTLDYNKAVSRVPPPPPLPSRQPPRVAHSHLMGRRRHQPTAVTPNATRHFFTPPQSLAATISATAEVPAMARPPPPPPPPRIHHAAPHQRTERNPQYLQHQQHRFQRRAKPY